jgi:hypothetical protein
MIGRHRMTRRAIAPTCLVLAALGPLTLAGAATAASPTRGFELVSPADGGAYDVMQSFATPALNKSTESHAATPDGGAFIGRIQSQVPVAGLAADNNTRDFLLSRRGASGWESVFPLGEVTTARLGAASEGNQPYDLSPDGQNLILMFGGSSDKPGDQLDPLDQEGGPSRIRFYGWSVTAPLLATYLTGKEGSEPRTDLYSASNTYLGSTPDRTTAVYFSTQGPLVAGDTNAVNDIYRRTAGRTELVSRTPSGAAAVVSGVPRAPLPVNPEGNGNPVAGAGLQHIVSADGMAVTFSSPAAMDVRDSGTFDDVYQVRGDEVTWISEPTNPVAQPPASRTFEGASADGNHVFLSTTERLTADDTDTAKDLYVYDATLQSGPRLARVAVVDETCADVSPNPCNDNASTVTPQQGNSAAHLATVSDDGSHAYFTTGDVLSPDDTDAQRSLYVHDRRGSRTFYVAPAGAGVTNATNGLDAGPTGAESLVKETDYNLRPIFSSQDGTVAVFLLATRVNLPAGRGGPDATPGAVKKLFVWRQGDGLRRIRQGPAPDDVTATPVGLSCGFASTASNIGGCRRITDDGRQFFFTTAGGLVTGDTNGVDDVYAVDTTTGEVELISAPGRPGRSVYVDSSASGGSVFFLTRESLDPSRDRDNGRNDLYVARVGGGFPPLPDEAQARCSGDACQEPFGGSSPSPLIGSVGFSGHGNVPWLADLSVRVLKSKAVTGSAGMLRVRVLGAGRISVAGSLIRRREASASKGGTYSVRVVLSTRAKRQLRKRGRLKVRARVAYRTKDGRSASKTVSVTFKQPKVKPAKIGKGGR